MRWIQIRACNSLHQRRLPRKLRNAVHSLCIGLPNDRALHVEAGRAPMRQDVEWIELPFQLSRSLLPDTRSHVQPQGKNNALRAEKACNGIVTSIISASVRDSVQRYKWTLLSRWTCLLVTVCNPNH